MVNEGRPDGHASTSLTKVARVDLLPASQATTIITCNDPFNLEPTTLLSLTMPDPDQRLVAGSRESEDMTGVAAARGERAQTAPPAGWRDAYRCCGRRPARDRQPPRSQAVPDRFSCQIVRTAAAAAFLRDGPCARLLQGMGVVGGSIRELRTEWCGACDGSMSVRHAIAARIARFALRTRIAARE